MTLSGQLALQSLQSRDDLTVIRFVAPVHDLYALTVRLLARELHQV
jgi:hypothetical protein